MRQQAARCGRRVAADLLTLIVLVRLERERAEHGRTAVAQQAAPAPATAAEQQAEQTARHGAPRESAATAHGVETAAEATACGACLVAQALPQDLIE
jgi:hypothetical protein